MRYSVTFLWTLFFLAQTKAQRGPEPKKGISVPYKAKPTYSEGDVRIYLPRPWCDGAPAKESHAHVKFCEDDSNYPEKIIENFLHHLTESEKVVLLSNTERFVSDEEYFDDIQKQSLNTHKASFLSAEGIISSDSMAAYDEEPVCTSVKTKFYPKKGINSDNEWR